jgi:hypothetical protein
VPKNDGYDDTHDQAADYKEGWQTGHDASDPDNPAGAGDTKDKVHDEVKDKSPEEKEAYKQGYAQGAESNK